MKTLLMTMALTMAAVSAQAQHCKFNRLKNCIRKGGVAAGDILTLGETERKRHEDKANQAKQNAAAAEALAQRILQEKTADREKALLDLTSRLTLIDKNTQAYHMVLAVFRSQMVTLKAVFGNVALAHDKNAALMEVIQMQYQDLADFASEKPTSTFDRNSEVSRQMSIVTKKVEQYREQITLLPQGQSDISDQQNWFQDLMSKGYEITSQVQQMITVLKTEKSLTEAKIKRVNEELKTLKPQQPLKQ